MRLRLHSLVSFVFSISVTTALSQPLYTLISPNEEHLGYFGCSAAMAGDVDGDGLDDIVVGASGETVGSSLYAGRVYVFSGATGVLLTTLVSPNVEAGGQFGCSVSRVSDVDNDGHDDVIIGACGESPWSSPSGAGRVYVLGGAAGGLIRTLVSPEEEESGGFGFAVSSAGDVDNDGIDDVVVGTKWADPGSSPTDAGRAYVFSGANGDLLHALVSPNEEYYGRFGCSVADAGDANGDGFGDVVVGAYGESSGSSLPSVGRVYLFDGVSGELIRELLPPDEDSGAAFGYSVASIVDIDGDGCRDLVVGAPGSDFDSGRVYVFGGCSGNLLYTFVSPNYQLWYGWFGGSVARAGDTDGDGYDDIVVGARAENPDAGPEAAGRVHVFSGSTGALLFTVTSPNADAWGYFGDSVSGGGDVNGDGYADIVIGATYEDPGASPSSAGRAYVFSGFMVPVELSVFEAKDQEEGVLIRWRTESEQQTFGFHLHRQQDGGQARIRITDQIIPGHGTTAVPQEYTFVDRGVPPGSYQYWLEEIAEDGRRTEYGPTVVTVEAPRLRLDGPHPNPVRDDAELRIQIPRVLGAAATLRLFDAAGRQMGASIPVDRESPLIRWSSSDAGASPGIYWWRLDAGAAHISRPMVVVR